MIARSIRWIIADHQPCGGGYGIALECRCGDEFSAAHQLEMLADAGFDIGATS